ncbi:unnamed protein product [Urochloa humidicola]
MDLNLIDDILVLILHRIDSPASLIRAASTCKQWHAIISSAAFLRRFRSARSSSLVAGDYFNDHKLSDFIMDEQREPGVTYRPSFLPAAGGDHRRPPLLPRLPLLRRRRRRRRRRQPSPRLGHP